MKKDSNQKTLFLQPDRRFILRAQAARVVNRDRMLIVHHQRTLAYLDRLEFRV